MSGKRVTIKDLANELKLSTSTVSRALGNRADVSPQTKQLVQELAEAWDYQPDPVAVSLKSRETRTIGVIIPQIVNRFFSKALAGIQEVANAKGYNLLISQSDESYDKEVSNLNTLVSNRVDGLIVSVSKETTATAHFEKVINSDTPIIFFDRVMEELETSRVIIDDHEASYKAIEHLINEGCQNISYISGPPTLYNNKKRLEGFKDAMKAHNREIDLDLLVFATYRNDEVADYTNKLLDLPTPPDGIFALNDATAIQMISIIKKRGLRIPEDVAIVGFNNEVVGQYLDPSLTSVASPARELGRTAAELLLSHIQLEDLPTNCKVLKSELIIRESSQKSARRK